MWVSREVLRLKGPDDVRLKVGVSAQSRGLVRPCSYFKDGKTLLRGAVVTCIVRLASLYAQMSTPMGELLRLCLLKFVRSTIF